MDGNNKNIMSPTEVLISENHVLNELYQQIFDKLTSNILVSTNIKQANL